jgi:hypothetical protein
MQKLKPDGQQVSKVQVPRSTNKFGNIQVMVTEPLQSGRKRCCSLVLGSYR